MIAMSTPHNQSRRATWAHGPGWWAGQGAGRAWVLQLRFSPSGLIDFNAVFSPEPTVKRILGGQYRF